MKKYDTVIFDMDGTLLYTLEDLKDAMNHVLSQHGYPERTLEECRRAMGNGARRFMEDLLPGGAENPEFEQMLKEYGEYYREHSQIKTRPYEGIAELLNALKDQQIKMAIVSNKGDVTVKKLNQLYFGEVIEIAVGEREGIRRKPAPDTVEEALKILGSAKEQSLYVGDSEVDSETAVNAGMDCALVSWGFRDRDQLELLKAEYIIDSPQELLDIL